MPPNFDKIPFQLALRISPASVLTIHCGQGKFVPQCFICFRCCCCCCCIFSTPFSTTPKMQLVTSAQPAARSFPRRKLVPRVLGLLSTICVCFASFFSCSLRLRRFKSSQRMHWTIFQGWAVFSRRGGGAVFHEGFQCMQTAEPEPQLVESSQR